MPVRYLQADEAVALDGALDGADDWEDADAVQLRPPSRDLCAPASAGAGLFPPDLLQHDAENSKRNGKGDTGC